MGIVFKKKETMYPFVPVHHDHVLWTCLHMYFFPTNIGLNIIDKFGVGTEPETSIVKKTNEIFEPHLLHLY